MINGETVVFLGKENLTHRESLYRVAKKVLPFRWFLIFGFGFFVLFFEGFELFEYSGAPPFSDPHIRIELLLYLGIILLVALLAEIYVRLLRKHSHALNLLKLKHLLSQDLIQTKDWNDVCVHICQKLGEFGHFDEVLLFAFENDSSAYQAAASWKTGALESNLAHDLARILDEDCGFQDNDYFQGLKPVECKSTIRELDLAGTYCLPIRDRLTPVARLYFRLSPGVSLSNETSDLLENIENEIAIALTTTRLRQEHAEMKVAKATDELRQIIAQDLHDTLGQNLCYLRMKLDQFTQPDNHAALTTMKPELAFLRDLSNDSYEMVRGLLVAMSPESSMRLEKLLEYHARLVSDRTGIHFKISHHNQPYSLDPTLVHHIYFIFREALSNIERHAQAQLVTVNVEWEKEALSIKISDDGIGFDPDMKPALGHYGLKIMEERAQALGGRLNLSSSTGEGTHIAVWLPLAA